MKDKRSCNREQAPVLGAGSVACSLSQAVIAGGAAPEQFRQVIQVSGKQKEGRVILSAPYSPDLNPYENINSDVKYGANCHRTEGSRRPDNRDFCAASNATNCYR
jgi:hypothetical protein